VSFGSLSQTYDGTLRSVSVTTSPPGLTVDVTYNGVSSPPINLGIYTVIVRVADLNYEGSATASLQILPPPSVPYLTAEVLGGLRNASNSWRGMKFQVGGSPITLTELGRLCVSGNSGEI